MTAGHLITDRDLTFLCDVDADCLVYARSKLVAVLSCEEFCVDDGSVCAVRYL